jgi:forkhead box protein K
MERSTGERGKGFYWSIDENFEHVILEQDAKLLTSQSAAANKEGKGTNKKAKGPLPPPLTSAPLAMKSSAAAASSMSTFRAHPPPSATTTIVKPEAPSTQSIPPRTNMVAGTPVSTLTPKAEPSAMNGALVPPTVPTIPSSVRIPIIVGPVPESHVPSSSTELSSSTSPHLPSPPIVLHENTLILNPTIFGHLTADQLKGLETLGAQKALEILQGYIVRFLKERIRTEGGRGRGRGNGARGRGRGMRGGNVCTGRGKNDTVAHNQDASVTGVVSDPVSVSVQSQEMPSAPAPSGGAGADLDTDVVIDIMEDDEEEEEEERASKKRKLDDETLPIALAG